MTFESRIGTAPWDRTDWIVHRSALSENWNVFDERSRRTVIAHMITHAEEVADDQKI